MSRRSWVLTDVDRGLHIDQIRLRPSDVGSKRTFSVRKLTLRGGLRDGLDVVEVDNGSIRFWILPDRGMGIWRIWHGDLTLAWPSPVKGPVNPRYVPMDEPTGVGWLRGFDELLCRCGLEFNGAPEWGLDGRLLHTLHGRIANLPAHYVELTIDADREEIIVTGVVDEARLFGNNLRLRSTVRTRLGEPSLSFTDEILNLATHPCDLELLYHINFGPPVAAPGSRFYAPARTIAPRDPRSAVDMATWQEYGPEQAGSHEVVLYFELAHDSEGRTGVILADPTGERGVSLHFNVRELPIFCLWKNRQPVADGYCTGLEPALNFPNVKSYERAQGRVVILAPGETRTCSVELKVHKGAAEIVEMRNRLAALESGTKPKIIDRPQSGWSPDA